MGWNLRIHHLVIVRSLLLLVLLIFSAGAVADEAWQRTWTVSSIICDGCTRAQKDEMAKFIGAKITLHPNHFDNPLYENCTKSVDYSDIHPVSITEAERIFKPLRLPEQVTGGLIGGRVKCAEKDNMVPNTIARFIFAGKRAFYLFEGGATMEMR